MPSLNSEDRKEGATVIIQTAPAGEPVLAIMMREHTALSGQFARAFGNDRFDGVSPYDLVTYVVENHDAGWSEFDRAPVTDGRTDLPYNLIDTPPEYITITSGRSPDFNERHHDYCGLLSSMHSWGLYNGRYGLSNLVLIDKIPRQSRAVVDRMLAHEVSRQERIKLRLSLTPEGENWIAKNHLFQNYKQLQFFDTLALYFNRTHPSMRGTSTFEHVPLDPEHDATVTIRPLKPGVYAMSPYPFTADNAEFGFAGRFISPGLNRNKRKGDWLAAMNGSPSRWECFRLVSP